MLGTHIEVSLDGDQPRSFNDPSDGHVQVIEVARWWGAERVRVKGEAEAVVGVYDLARDPDGTWRRLRRWVTPIDRSAAQLSLL